MPRILRLLAGLALALLVAAPAAAAASPFPSRIDLPTGWQPEGLSLGRGTTFFVGSLANGAILRGDLRTGGSAVLVPGAAGTVAVGTEYERGANRVWSVGGPTGAVRAYDASDGVLLAAYQFAAGFLNDLAITRDAVYVTDSSVAQLDVIPLGPGGALPAPGAAFTLPLTGALAIQPGFNLNGIVAAHGWLVAVQSNTGLLFRIDPATGRTWAIDTGGRTVVNGDGLQIRGSALYVIRNQDEVVDVFRLGPGLASATFLGSITSADPAAVDVPTTGILAVGRLWVVNARFNTLPTPDTAYWITSLPARP
jgi:hypothetical protein